MTKTPQKLADVISIARKSQQTALTPEQIADDTRRTETQNRLHALTMAAPDITPAVYSRIAADSLEQTPCLLAVAAWLSGPARVLILSGGVGVGKTTAAAWALAQRSGRFVAAADLPRISTDFDRGEWNKLVCTHVCNVDDVGSEPKASGVEQALVQLLNARMRYAGRTLITSNLTVPQLQERYRDERLWSRIIESYEAVSAGGDDLRRRGK